MKKGMRLLAICSATALLLCGCGTPLYEMTDEEEDLVVQGAAYMLSKHNIFQKDGMNGTLPVEEEEETEEVNTEGSEEASSENQGGTSTGSSGTAASGETITLAESIGYKDKLEVTYEGFSLMDVYKEGSYFSLSAASGKTFVVMQFAVSNLTGEDIQIDNYEAGYAFYCSFEGTSHVPEKQSFIADSLASYEGTIPADKSARAVLIFEIAKEQAEMISEPTLTMEHNGTSYSIKL